MDRSRYYQGYTKVLSGSVSSKRIVDKLWSRYGFDGIMNAVRISLPDCYP
ncbi:MAG: hypothetical protein GX587_07945 [Bacteroidales bacterium]|nr:hypothetical protein [Bacteroidales bacterium]